MFWDHKNSASVQKFRSSCLVPPLNIHRTSFRSCFVVVYDFCSWVKGLFCFSRGPFNNVVKFSSFVITFKSLKLFSYAFADLGNKSLHLHLQLCFCRFCICLWHVKLRKIFFFFLHCSLFPKGCGGNRSRLSCHTSRSSITSIILLRWSPKRFHSRSSM